MNFRVLKQPSFNPVKRALSLPNLRKMWALSDNSKWPLRSKNKQIRYYGDRS